MAIPEQPFGFVAGRWVLSLADTPMDSDRAPDYKPLYPGSVIFNNKLSHRVVTDGSETVGIVKTRYEARLNEDGRLIDAEEHEFVALPVGVYSVTFSFGQYSWPNFDIEVKPEHTIDSPLWLPSKSPVPAGPGIVHVVSEEARLAAEAAAASAWEAVDTPGRQGPKGAKGDQGLSGEIAGTVRFVNLMGSRNYQLTGYAQPTSSRVTLSPGHKYYARKTYDGPAHTVSGSIRALSDPNHIFVGATVSSAVSTYSGTEVLELAIYTYGVAGQTYNMTDVILVDLTETFGSGNEPGRDYMDNLVRREGGWFDTSSPIVGNVFAENVVMGPGMTVRRDLTVGERVLLDHPGGTTMLYGDTGWRDIAAESSNLDFDVGGGLRVRRQNNLVTFRIFLGAMPTATGFAGSFWTPSLGFKALDRQYTYFSRRSGPTFRFVVTVLSSGIYVDEIPTSSLVGFITYETGDAWPTTLPGTPL